MVEDLSELECHLLVSAYHRRAVGKKPLPVYRLLGVIEDKRFSRNTLRAATEHLRGVPHPLFAEGWTFILYEGGLYVLLGEYPYREGAQRAQERGTDTFSLIFPKGVVVSLHDPDGDIALDRLSLQGCRIVRARAPVFADLFVNELVAEFFYVPYVPATISLARLEQDMGTGRFNVSMGTLSAVARRLAERSLLVVVPQGKTLGVVLTREGYDLAVATIAQRERSEREG